MTIAISIKTSSAIVFAADSKVSTSGIGGYDDKGDIIWIPQSYDNVYKVAHDQNRQLMAMVAGYGDIGRMPATDFFIRYHCPIMTNEAEQDRQIEKLANEIGSEVATYWSGTKVDQAKWRAPSLWVAAASTDGFSGRIWKGSFSSPTYTFEEQLKNPGIRLDGSYEEVYSLLYGINWENLREILTLLGITDTQLVDAITKSKIARPVDKINFWTMPTQDAIELAVFLARVQIQMDRFLPGDAVCGGPVDVMVLQTTPAPSIITYLKALHYPVANG